MATATGNLWGIVLSGGEGTRLEKFIERIYGIVRPKQYCSLVGTRSMLQHTIDRTKSLIRPQKIVTIVNTTHRPYVEAQLKGQPGETILVQPCNRDTGTGILLSLLHVHSRDPRAVVGIFPSDHFILQERHFMQYVRRAFALARRDRSSVVLLGVPSSQVEPEYGWIEKDSPVSNPWHLKTHRVRRFWEKPDRSTAERLFQEGCLWNTMVLVGSAATFLSFFRMVTPESFRVLNDIVRMNYPEGKRDALLELVYPDLPALNFSRAILERFTERLCVLEIPDIYWSDWGSESRVLNDVDRLHLKLHAGGGVHAVA